MRKLKVITGIVIIVVCLAWLAGNNFFQWYFRINYGDRFQEACALSAERDYAWADKIFRRLLADWKKEGRILSRLRPFFVSNDLPRAVEERMAHDGYAEAFVLLGDKPDLQRMIEQFKPKIEASSRFYRKLKVDNSASALLKMHSLFGLAATEVQTGLIYLHSFDEDSTKNAAEKFRDALDYYLEALRVYNSLPAGERVGERQLALQARRNIEFISRSFKGQPDQPDQPQDEKRHGLGDIVKQASPRQAQPDQKMITDKKKAVMLDAGVTPPPSERK